MSALLLDTVMIPDSPAPGDAELVARFIAARDEAAFAELVRRHSPVVLGVCRRVLHDSHDVDDVFQATFLVFVRDAARVRKQKSMASWFYGVAFRLSLRVIRQKQRRKETVLAEETLVDDDTFGKLAELHDRQQLDIELNALPDKYRQPLVLKYLVGKSSAEVAAELGITVGAVDGLVKRGKYELRQRLLQRGITLGTTLGAALVAIQMTQQAVQAAGAESLIETTIQAGLAWDLGSDTIPTDLISDRAVELAAKEVIAMTTATKTAIAVGLTIGGLAFGLGGAGLFFGNSQGGDAEAAGIMKTMSTVLASAQPVEMATISADQADKPETSQGAGPGINGEALEREVPLGSAGADNKAESPSIARWDLKPRSQRVLKIESALEEDTDMDFNDIPLKDALGYLESQHHIEIKTDDVAMNEAGISKEQNVNFKLSAINLKSALKLILEPLQLECITRNDVLMVTTHEKADEIMDTRVYNISRLHLITAKELVEILPAMTSGKWQKADGEGGTGNAVGNTLVIRQTHRVHDEIVDLLDQLDHASTKPKPASPVPAASPRR